MTRRRKIFDAVVSAFVGLLLGAVLALGAEGLNDGRGPRPQGEDRSASLLSQNSPKLRRSITKTRPQKSASAARILLAWSLGGLPPGAERVVGSMPQVQGATTVLAGLDWLTRSRNDQGALVDNPAKGYRIPIETALVRPRDYIEFVSPADRELVLGLGRGEALLSETESELRGAGAGLRVDLGQRSTRVAGVVSDATTNGYEMLMRGPVPRSWGRVESFLLVHLERPEARAAVERRFKRLLAPGQAATIRSSKETPFLRYGDAVLPQLLVKETFGEFAARPNPDGTLDIDPAWVKRNIRSARVPILGDVTCHRALVPQLRNALSNIQALGLAYRVDPVHFGGCFGPRFIDRDPAGRISHHAWGIAVDLNVDENPQGARPSQDRRVVEEMMRWGFTWGGTWSRPDGMHFEWIRFP